LPQFTPSQEAEKTIPVPRRIKRSILNGNKNATESGIPAFSPKLVRFVNESIKAHKNIVADNISKQ
jgi:hypothetical protein